MVHPKTRDVKGTGFCGTGHVPSRPVRTVESEIIFFAGWGGTGLEFSGQAKYGTKRDKLGHVIG